MQRCQCFKGTVVNRALPILHGALLENKLTVPLKWVDFLISMISFKHIITNNLIWKLKKKD